MNTMNMMTPGARMPPIEDLLPHRGTMLLLDRVTDFDTESASAEYRPRRDAWYADADGHMPAWIGIELMAQTIAAHVGLLKRAAGAPPRQGVLLGARRYVASRAAFAADEVLCIRSKVVLSDAGGLGAYECRIDASDASGSEALATATLKVFEPDDFQTFLQASQA
ncbi:MAG: hotdog family protein [Propionivibrio sp.]